MRRLRGGSTGIVEGIEMVNAGRMQRRLRPLRRVWLLPVGLVMVSSTAAEIYKWRDEQGVMRYSDRPPAARVQYTEVSQQLPDLNEMEPTSLPTAEGRRQSRPGAQSRPPGRSHSQESLSAQQKQCQVYRQALEQVQRQLRAGYSNERGNRLRERRRMLSEKLYRQCPP